MKTIETYLFFDGNCAEAMRFYERTLAGKLSLMTAKEAPPDAPMPPGSGDRIMHSRLEADGAVLMASDWLAPAPFGKTFYSDGFGMLVDRFGTPWMVMATANTPS
jgi:PhnB protein